MKWNLFITNFKILSDAPEIHLRTLKEVFFLFERSLSPNELELFHKKMRAKGFEIDLLKTWQTNILRFMKINNELNDSKKGLKNEV